MAESSADSLLAFDFDPRTMRYPYDSRLSWSIPIDQTSSPPAPNWADNANLGRSTTPLDSMYDQPIDPQAQQQHQPQHQAFVSEWPMSQPSTAHLAYHLDNTYSQQFAGDYTVQYQTSPTDFIPPQAHLDPTLHLDTSYLPPGGQMESMSLNWHSWHNDLMDYSGPNGVPDISLSQQNLNGNSPTGSCLDARSLTNSSNDGWVGVDYHHPYGPIDVFQDLQPGAISNPEQALHPRTCSDSSFSDAERQSQHSWSSGVDVFNAIGSPGSDSFGEVEFYNGPRRETEKIRPSPPAIVTSTAPRPIPKKKPRSPQRSPVSTGRSSPPNKRQPRKDPSPKTTKSIIRRPPQLPKPAPEPSSEKKVGKRKGPLGADQRKRASEIRKLGACLRCKFLKKTCDKGEPCQGCLPSHARLWQVPCTRIDIKEIAYFMKDWKADYERHASLEFSLGNIKGFADAEHMLYITHGYGYFLPVRAREVFVMDEMCFGSDWVEKIKDPEPHEVNTMRWTAGLHGISSAQLSEYLDKHIDSGFESFVDNYFEGTPFLTQMVKTVYHYWSREKTPVIRKSLKLLLAYNLTQHITMVEPVPDDASVPGKIHDENSRFHGKVVAPVMINFQVKSAMADMWRELQKDVLEELSHLYSSVYTRDKLKHWPTIFMVATILLTVWEEMQFDCHYRIPDKAVVNQFCHDMESTPVGVIVNLFLAISQKLPALSEWDTHKHHNLLNSNPAVCDALTEVRENVNRHGKSFSNFKAPWCCYCWLTRVTDGYLRGRCNATFDRNDFDSLSNKFTSKLVIRAN
ncbi:MAG: hypothetical protein Q9181_004862 [Wetmoreana brouardii]